VTTVEIENTIAAFEAAERMGIDGVELDVRATADGAPAIHHDPQLTDGRTISKLMAEELPAYVPLLDGALDALASLVVNIEIKEPRSIADAVVSEVRSRRIESRVVVSSFDLATIDRVKRLDDSIPTGYLVTPAHRRFASRSLNTCRRHGHDAYHPYFRAVDKRLIDAAHAAGIADDDIQTTNVAINPRYDTPTGRAPRIVGYSADNSFVVKLRDAAKDGATIDALSAAAGDAVQVQGIAYSFDDDTKLLDEARKDAVARARAQAQQLADAADVHLGAVRSVTDAGAPTSLYGFQAVGAGSAARDAVAVPVSPGTQQLTMTVTVVFDIA